MQSDGKAESGIEEDGIPGGTHGGPLALCFAILAAGTCWAALRNPFWGHQLELFVVVSIASGGWLFASFLAARGAGRVRWIVAGAILLRLVALFGEPDLSDDVNRYVWEGSLVADGISPYALAPDAVEYEARRAQLAAIFADLNNASISAAYPPLVEAVFGAVVTGARLAGDEDGRLARVWMRWLFTLCDLLVLWPLASLLKRFKRPSSLLVTWAWCPLITFEFAGSGHFDSFGVLTLVAALALLTTNRSQSHWRAWKDSAGAVLASAAIFVKILPLCAVPFILRGDRRYVRAAVLVGASLFWLLPLAFWVGGTSSIDRGLTEYGTRWEGFNFVYSWIEAGIDAIVSGDRDRSMTDPRLLGRALIGLVWCVYLAVLMRSKCEPVLAVGKLIALFLVLTPTLHPWYLAWVLPFAALRPSLHWLWVLATGVFLYAPLEGWNTRSEWLIPAWTWPVIVLPFLLLVVMDRRKADDSSR